MDYSEGFKYDELKVYSEHGTKYCMPVWAYQTDLNIKVATRGITPDTADSFKEWAESKKFPLFCNFDLPDGVYSAYLFRVCADSEKMFGIDISHYEYKGKNPSLSIMKRQNDDCPFDEVLPVPKQETEIFGDTSTTLKSECLHLESFLEGTINEIGMRKTDSVRLVNFEFTFPKYLYN